MVVSAALSSRKTRRSAAIAPNSVHQSWRAWAIAAVSCPAARTVFFFARQPQAAERSAHRPGVHACVGLVRKPVSILCQRPIIVALDQAPESGFHRIADHRSGAAAHRLGAIAA